MWYFDDTQVIIFSSNVPAGDCKLQLPRLSFFPPLVFTPNGTLKTTESNDIDDNNFVRISSDELVILSCAPNYFKSIDSTFLEATCKGNDVLGIYTNKCLKYMAVNITDIFCI